MKLISRLSIIPSSRDRFRGLVTNTTIWLLSCSALDGLIGARLRSTHPGLLRRGAETPTDDQEITEAGQFIFLFNISKKEKFIYIYNKRFVSNQKILLIDTITFFFFFFFSSWFRNYSNFYVRSNFLLFSMVRYRLQFVPDDLKDDKYWARRRKNNMAAKRSRDARRMKENQIALRAGFLEKEVNLPTLLKLKNTYLKNKDLMFPFLSRED